MQIKGTLQYFVLAIQHGRHTYCQMLHDYQFFQIIDKNRCCNEMYCFENVCHQKITKKKLCMKRLVTVLQFQILVDNKENQTRVGIAIKKTVNLKFAVNEISTPINYGFYFL